MAKYGACDTIGMDIDPNYVIHDPDALSNSIHRCWSGRCASRSIIWMEYCRAFIAASPLVIVGTQDGAADASPRGDFPGFVKVADEHTLLIPDRRGNNRLDTLRNLVKNPAVGLLFLVPGLHETFRVNGEAVVSSDPALTGQFEMQVSFRARWWWSR